MLNLELRAIRHKNIIPNLFISLSRASLRGHLNVSICMQRIICICIRSYRMMHADKSLAKWSALHPRVKFIVHELSPRAFMRVSRRRDFCYEIIAIHCIFFHILWMRILTSNARRHIAVAKNILITIPANVRYLGPISSRAVTKLSCRVVYKSFCRSSIYKKNDVVIFLILSSLSVFKLAFKRSWIREKKKFKT